MSNMQISNLQDSASYLVLLETQSNRQELLKQLLSNKRLVSGKTLVVMQNIQRFKDATGVAYADTIRFATWQELRRIEGQFDLIILNGTHTISEVNACNIYSKRLKGRIIALHSADRVMSDFKWHLINMLKLNVVYEQSTDAIENLVSLTGYSVLVHEVQLTYKMVSNPIQKKSDKKKSEVDMYKEVIDWIMHYRHKNQNTYNTLLRRMKLFLAGSNEKIGMAKKLFQRLPGRTILIAPVGYLAKRITSNIYYNVQILHDTAENTKKRICLITNRIPKEAYTNADNIILLQLSGTVREDEWETYYQMEHRPYIHIIELRDTRDDSYTLQYLEEFFKHGIRCIYTKKTDSKRVFQFL